MNGGCFKGAGRVSEKARLGDYVKEPEAKNNRYEVHEGPCVFSRFSGRRRISHASKLTRPSQIVVTGRTLATWSFGVFSMSESSTTTSAR